VAYPRYRDTKQGRVWYVSRRLANGRVATRRLGVVHESVARAQARAESERHGTRARPQAIAPLAALGEFIEHWRDVRRRSPQTVEFYDERIRPLFAWMGERGPMRAWCLPWFEEYVGEHPGWSPRTIETVAVGARTVTKFLRRRGYAIGEFARDYEGPRVPRGNREAYSAEQARAMLEASRGHRLEVAVHAALYAGLSHGDIAALRPSDIRDGWIVRSRAKSGVANLVPVARPLADVLAAHAPDDPATPYTELPASSDPWRSLCKRADVPSRGGLKRLRHTYSTLLDAAGVDSATRRDLMGHTPRSMTDLYTHSDRTRLVDAIRRLTRVLAPGRNRSHALPSVRTDTPSHRPKR
jgi:integrase